VQAWAFGTMPARHDSPHACFARVSPEDSDVVSASRPCVRGPHVLDCVRGQFDVSGFAVSRTITDAGPSANTRARARPSTGAGSGANTGARALARPSTGAGARPRPRTRTRTRTRAGTTTGVARLLRLHPRGRFHSRQSRLRAR
jgi:hypothetical protein